MKKTYKIIRFYANMNIEKEVIVTGLSLKEAQAHCNDPETSSRTCKGRMGRALTEKYGSWFDGYTEED